MSLRTGAGLRDKERDGGEREEDEEDPELLNSHRNTVSVSNVSKSRTPDQGDETRTTSSASGPLHSTIYSNRNSTIPVVSS